MTGIYFDIDDTLYDRQGLLIQAGQEALTWAAARAFGRKPGSRSLDLCPGLDQKEFVRIFYIKSDENFSLVENGTITARQSNVWRLEETFKAMGLPCPEGTGDLFADRYTYLQNHITLAPFLAEMFKRLRLAHVPVGILTNGESDHQWKKVRMLGLDRWIPENLAVVSGDVGISKPDAGIFRAAEQAMGLAPENLWLAGDSLKHDILGAKAAGWHTIWLDRRGAIGTSASADGYPESAAVSDLRADTEEALARMVLSDIFSL